MNNELAAAMPWLTAQPESIWEIDGTSVGGKVTRCLASVLPEYITGEGFEPQFDPLKFLGLFSGPSAVVPASSVTRAVPLVLVYADTPRETYYLHDQLPVNIAAERSQR